jgi:hypothetical protein
MSSDQLQGAFMLNPKDLRIMQLEGELAQTKSQLESCRKKPGAAKTVSRRKK